MCSLDNFHAALVHHWFLAMSGGERVCEAICEVLDTPDLYSIVADPKSLGPVLGKSSLKTSFIQHLPNAKRFYRYYAPLFPLAVESFDLTSYDLVISSDSSVVKGIKTLPETCHICMCYSPMRYAWNAFHDYTRDFGIVKRGLSSIIMSYLALYDFAASARVDYFVAPSQTSRNRIRKYYRRDAAVIYPPCDTNRFKPSSHIDDYYLFVGRLVSYKMADLAVKTFNRNKKRLLIVGDGPEMQKLKSMASTNIKFLGWVSDTELSEIYAKCKALIFPGEEDFGIVPVEAQAAGRPVIAYAKGGALETVIPDETGVFFRERSVGGLLDAIAKFEKMLVRFDTEKIVANAGKFSRSRFLSSFEEFVRQCVEDHHCKFRPSY
ncbi:MAG: glycosyltransferase [Desulfomonilaceae bacterium]